MSRVEYLAVVLLMHLCRAAEDRWNGKKKLASSLYIIVIFASGNNLVCFI